MSAVLANHFHQMVCKKTIMLVLGGALASNNVKRSHTGSPKRLPSECGAKRVLISCRKAFIWMSFCTGTPKNSVPFGSS